MALASKILRSKARNALMVSAAFLLLLNACKTNREVMTEWTEARQRDTQMEIQAEFAPPSTNQVLGYISWVDRNGPNAVVYLNNAQLHPTTTLLARDRDGLPRALLNPTIYRKKRALGVTLPYGKPSIGDEVILRSAATLPKEWERENYSSTTRPTQHFQFFIPDGKITFDETTTQKHTPPLKEIIISEVKIPKQKNPMPESWGISERKIEVYAPNGGVQILPPKE